MKTVLALFISVLMFQAHAAITVDASRVIYSGKDKSVSLKINNPGGKNYIVQTWLDTGTNAPTAKLPIVVTPPLVKLHPEQSAQLRFIYSGSGLPNDRESLYWINVQEVPPVAEGNNVLQFAIRTRLKLFYRPAGLHASLDEEVKKLQWSYSGKTLTFKNSGPLHITLVSSEIVDSKGSVAPLKNIMIPPYSTQAVDLPSGSRLHKLKYINDYGALVDIPLNK